MIGIVGTVPDREFPLVHGRVRWAAGQISVDGRRVPVNRCTPALLAAALRTADVVGGPEVYAFLVGDIGKGDGSRRLYRFLSRHLAEFDLSVVAFHYLQPDVDWHGPVLFATQGITHRPILIADAGFMYAAKMAGQSELYDIFTPDAGELAFLADPLAPHPFYTRGFILHQENNVPDLIRQAYDNGNAAACLVVKGAVDHIACGGQVVRTVARPSFAAMEAIGGTGDSLTGILSALCGAGYEPIEAAVLAARVNRGTGTLVEPTPATQVAELIDKIPQALENLLNFSQKEQIQHD